MTKTESFVYGFFILLFTSGISYHLGERNQKVIPAPEPRIIIQEVEKIKTLTAYECVTKYKRLGYKDLFTCSCPPAVVCGECEACEVGGTGCDLALEECQRGLRTNKLYCN